MRNQTETVFFYFICVLYDLKVISGLLLAFTFRHRASVLPLLTIIIYKLMWLSIGVQHAWHYARARLISFVCHIFSGIRDTSFFSSACSSSSSFVSFVCGCTRSLKFTLVIFPSNRESKIPGIVCNARQNTFHTRLTHIAQNQKSTEHVPLIRSSKPTLTNHFECNRKKKKKKKKKNRQEKCCVSPNALPRKCLAIGIDNISQH